MNVEQAVSLRKILKPKFCNEAIAQPIEMGSGKTPSDNAPAGVLCRTRVQQGLPKDGCFLIDGGECPVGLTKEGLPMDKITPLL